MKIAKKEKCTKSLVQIAVKNLKYHLNQMALDQYTVRNAIRNAENQEEDIKIELLQS